MACLEADFVPSLTTCTYLGVVYTRYDAPPLSALLLLSPSISTSSSKTFVPAWKSLQKRGYLLTLVLAVLLVVWQIMF